MHNALGSPPSTKEKEKRKKELEGEPRSSTLCSPEKWRVVSLAELKLLSTVLCLPGFYPDASTIGWN
jgi:hypothetical protein